MVRVAAFTVQGLDIFFHTSDHDPPHFHVLRSGQWEIRVFIDSSSEEGLAYNIKFPTRLPKTGRTLSAKLERTLLEHVLKNRVELLEEWQLKVCTREII
jgi:hypothetical protein